MRTIWKFPFEIKDKFTLEMPLGSSVIHVGMQNGTPCMWAIVNTDETVARFSFAIRGTGHEASGMYSGTHLGSFLMHGDALVFHLFRVHP